MEEYPDYNSPEPLEASDPEMGGMIRWYCSERPAYALAGISRRYPLWMQEDGVVDSMFNYPLVDAAGRNGACPCGSGKKCKKCCAAPGATERRRAYHISADMRRRGERRAAARAARRERARGGGADGGPPPVVWSPRPGRGARASLIATVAIVAMAHGLSPAAAGLLGRPPEPGKGGRSDP